MPEELILQATIKTPFISLKPSGQLEFRGSSYPENCYAFYQPVMEWLSAYSQKPASQTKVYFYFKYFNTSTSGTIVEMLGQLKSVSTKLEIVWAFDKDDEETNFSGQNFAELLDLTFVFEEK